MVLALICVWVYARELVYNTIDTQWFHYHWLLIIPHKILIVHHLSSAVSKQVSKGKKEDQSKCLAPLKTQVCKLWNVYLYLFRWKAHTAKITILKMLRFYVLIKVNPLWVHTQAPWLSLKKRNTIYGFTDTPLVWLFQELLHLLRNASVGYTSFRQTPPSTCLNEWIYHLIIFYWAFTMSKVLDNLGPIISGGIGLGLFNWILWPKCLLSVLWLLHWDPGTVAVCFPCNTSF